MSNAETFWIRMKSDDEQEELIRAMADQSARTKLAHGELFVERERIIARKIRDQRVAADLSQAEVAKRMTDLGMEMQQSTIAKIESARRPLRLAEVFALAHVLSVPYLALLLAPRDVEPEETYLDSSQRFLELHVEMKAKAEEMMAESLASSAKMYAEAEAAILWISHQMMTAGADATRRKEVTGDASPENPNK